MSDDIRMGRKARKICTVMAAVFAVALMLAVPVFTAVDTDAGFKEDEVGLLTSMDNPYDSELSKYLDTDRTSVMTKWDAPSLFMSLFNTPTFYGVFGTPEITQEKLTVKDGMGVKVESDSAKEIGVREMDATDVKMVFTAVGSGDLLVSGYDYLDNGYPEAGKAIIKYLGGTVSAGDVLTITGHIKSRCASEEDMNYAAVNDEKSVLKDGVDQWYCVYDVDVTIELKKSGASEGKSITFSSNLKYMKERKYTMDYKGKAYSDLQPTDLCKIVYDSDLYECISGSSNFSVDGTDYTIDYSDLPPTPVDQPVKILTNSEVKLDTYREMIDDYPESAGNATVEKTYSAADSEFSAIVADVASDEILLVILIIVGVVIGIIVLVVVLVVLLVVLKKKKKNEQKVQ